MMRRWLNNAYLAQTILMLLLMALLVLLAMRGISALAFSLLFLVGIGVAALPGIYSGFVLPRREFQRRDRILRTGLPATARVLQDGESLLSEFRRSTMSHKGVKLLLDMPAMLHPDEERARQVSLKVDIDSVQVLRAGMLVSVRCDPDDSQFVVLDGPGLAAS